MKKTWIFILLILLPFQIYSQTEPVYNDTAYFIPFDNDFNLILSASRGHINNVLNLLERGADINTVTVDEISALMYAAENGDLQMVKLLVEKGAKVDMRPWNGVTALISACQLNHFSVAEFLISSGASINSADDNGVTPVHYAAVYNYIELLKMLIFYQADVNKADKDGNTPLISAAFNNSIESVKILVEQGVNIDQKDKKGFTALMVAVQEGNTEIADFLMENGSDINIVNDGGLTALAFAVKSQNYDLTESLVEKDADINHRISGSQNILQLSKEYKDDEITELLLTEGAQNNYIPNFNKMSVGAGILFCSREFMTGLDYTALDSKYNLTLNSGFYFRPKALRVQTHPENDTIYQYWERRYAFHAGLEKRFNLYSSGQVKTGLMAGYNSVLTFGSYRGSQNSPETRILSNPYAGLYFTDNLINLALQYEYLNLDIPGYNNGRVKLKIGFCFPVTKKTLSNKQIRWLSK